MKNREDVGIKHLNDPKVSIGYSNAMDDAYNYIDDYNRKRKGKILIIFDDMIADIMTNKKFHAKIKELFIRYLLYLSHNLIFLFQTKLD